MSNSTHTWLEQYDALAKTPYIVANQIINDEPLPYQLLFEISRLCSIIIQETTEEVPLDFSLSRFNRTSADILISGKKRSLFVHIDLGGLCYYYGHDSDSSKSFMLPVCEIKGCIQWLNNQGCIDNLASTLANWMYEEAYTQPDIDYPYAMMAVKDRAILAAHKKRSTKG